MKLIDRNVKLVCNSNIFEDKPSYKEGFFQLPFSVPHDFINEQFSPANNIKYLSSLFTDQTVYEILRGEHTWKFVRLPNILGDSLDKGRFIMKDNFITIIITPSVLELVKKMLKWDSQTVDSQSMILKENQNSETKYLEEVSGTGSHVSCALYFLFVCF